MAGPIRELLYRRPVRNAVRALLGLQPRYGFMGNETGMFPGQRMQQPQSAPVMTVPVDADPGEELPAPPSARPVIPSTPQPRTTAVSIAPSPEAAAVATARDADSQRTTAIWRGEAMSPTARPMQPAAAPTPPASAMPPANAPSAVQLNNVGQAEPSPPQQAAPADARLARIELLRSHAAERRDVAGRMERDPRFLHPDNAAGRLQYDTIVGQAQKADEQADALQTQMSREAMVLQMQTAAQRNAETLARIQHPDDSLGENVRQFENTVRQYGVMAAAQFMTEAWVQSSNPALPINDPARAQKYNEYALLGSSLALSDRINSRTAFQPGDPMTAELVSVIQSLAPEDPSARARYVNGIVSRTQRDTGISSAAAARISEALTQEIEQRIAAQKSKR